MSITIKTTIVDAVIKKVPVVTRVQTNTGYEFINSLTSVRECLMTGDYSIFVNHIRGKNNDAPFQKGHYCASYKEAIEYIASHEEDRYRIDLVLRNREHSSAELAAIAANLDF